MTGFVTTAPIDIASQFLLFGELKSEQSPPDSPRQTTGQRRVSEKQRVAAIRSIVLPYQPAVTMSATPGKKSGVKGLGSPR